MQFLHINILVTVDAVSSMPTYMACRSKIKTATNVAVILDSKQAEQVASGHPAKMLSNDKISSKNLSSSSFEIYTYI